MAEAGQPNILIVDDDERVRTLLSWQLEAEGLTVRVRGGRDRGPGPDRPGIDEMMQPGPPQKRGVFAGAGYGMGWFTGPWGGLDASCHPGDEPGAHAGMALVPQGNWGVVVLFNVGTHGGALPGLLAIEQSVTGMVVGGTVRDTGIGAFYAGLDAAVAAALAAEGWSLARLPGVVAQGRRRALPLLWEFGIPAAVAVVPTAVFKVNWKGLFPYGPDMSCALAGIGGLSALTGLLRVIKAGHSVRSRPLTRRMPATTRRR